MKRIALCVILLAATALVGTAWAGRDSKRKTPRAVEEHPAGAFDYNYKKPSETHTKVTAWNVAALKASTLAADSLRLELDLVDGSRIIGIPSI